jgi:integrase
VKQRKLPPNIMEARGYVGFVAYLRSNGKQINANFSVTTYGSELAALDAAEIWLPNEKANRRSGQEPDIPDKRVTLRTVGESWYEHGKTHANWRASTRIDYRYVLDALLEDFGADTRLANLNAARIRAWQSKLLEDGLGRRTVEKRRMILGGIFEHARERYHLRVNPVRDVTAPKPDPRSALDFYSVEEVKALVRAAESKQDGVLFLTAALTGLRRGELIALRVGNVDNNGATIRVEGSYSHGALSLPKSGDPRPVPMAEEVAKAIARLLTERADERGQSPGKQELVFPGPDGEYMDGSALRRRFIRARDAAGLRPLRFHDLRHVFGSLAIRKADIVQVQKWMGHANVNTTRRYLHHKARADDAKILDSAFGEDALVDGEPSEPTTMELVAELRREVAELKELTRAGMARTDS